MGFVGMGSAFHGSLRMWRQCRSSLPRARARARTPSSSARGYGALPQAAPSNALLSSRQCMELEHLHSAHNYHPIPAVFSRANDVSVWDPEGRTYLDFLSAYSAVNQGHCHPKVVGALVEQAQRLTLSSRAFFNDKFSIFAKLLTSTFQYDMMLPMNTGAEGVETAIKLARKWGYQKKNIKPDEAIIVSCCGCFHGRTLGVISMSCDNEAVREYGPLLPGLIKVKFGDIKDLAMKFEEYGDRIAGFLFEPIQGEAGVFIPADGYLESVRELCTKQNVLMIADEIQTGLARTGKMLACDWEAVRPDIVILGKALGAGVLPVSAILADKDIMLCIRPGEHGSTFGGNPLASAVGIAALEVIQHEKLAERANEMGEKFRGLLKELQSAHPGFISEVRGRGLLNAIELNHESMGSVSAFDICVSLKDRGILAKPTHETIIRLSPPLTIRSHHLEEAVKALSNVLEFDLPNLQANSSGQLSNKPPEKCHRCGSYT